MPKKKRNLQISVGNPLALGAVSMGDGVNFALYDREEVECSVVLYEPCTRNECYRIPFQENMVFGHIKAMHIGNMQPGEYDYAFCVDHTITTDPYAKKIRGSEVWGQHLVEPITCGIQEKSFNWEEDSALHIPFEDTIIYRLHVRGFTKDSTSKVKKKGTFRGIIERIPYLKELGITMVELMPAYDFREVAPTPKPDKYMGLPLVDERINYWGYVSGNYFVPKASYAADVNRPDEEFCQMVKALHQNGIEVSMEFYFKPDMSPCYILDCLQFWVLHYHIDGIHVSAEDVVLRMIEKDPLLARTKIMGYGVQANGSQAGKQVYVARYSNEFITRARRYLKGDEDQAFAMAELLKSQPKEMAEIHYIANHGTFTLHDLVSYDRKHNEDNGEGNRDGEDYNYSWNCGEEGPSRKKRVQNLRMRQTKNALAMVLLGQAVPMLYAGDEYGNSQQGNNNPYCQDNPVGWVNWNPTRFNKEIFQFTKELIAFRKAHGILHMKKQLEMSDYHALGLPDLSFHSNAPWFSDFSHVNRHFAMLYCGAYAKLDEKEPDTDIYIAWNMHWEQQQFAVPKATGKKHWEICIATGDGTLFEDGEKLAVPPRTVVVLTAREIQSYE